MPRPQNEVVLFDSDAEFEGEVKPGRMLESDVRCPSCHLPTVMIGDELWCQWEHILVAVDKYRNAFAVIADMLNCE